MRDLLDETADRIGRDLQDQPAVEAELRTSIGNVYKQLAEYEKAETMYQAALKLRQSSLGPDDPEVIFSLLRVADVLGERGDLTGAEALLHEALVIHGKSLASGQAADDGWHASRRSRFLAEVQSIQRRLLEARRKLKGDDDPDVIKTRVNIGGVAGEQGELDAAESSLREALAQQRRQFGPEHRDIALTLMNLGAISFSRGQYGEAEKTWREALAMQRKLLGPAHPDIAGMLMNLTAVAMVRKDYATAETLGSEALAMQRKLFPPEHPSIAMALDNLGAVLVERGDAAGAEPLFRESLAMSRKLFGDQSPMVASALNNLTDTLQKEGRPAEAEALAREALVVWEHTDPDAWRGFSTRFQIGVSLAAQKKFAEAEPLLLAGYEGMKSREQSMRPDERADNLPDALDHLVQFYTDSRQPHKVAEWRQKLDAYNQAVATAKPAGRPP